MVFIDKFIFLKTRLYLQINCLYTNWGCECNNLQDIWAHKVTQKQMHGNEHAFFEFIQFK